MLKSVIFYSDDVSLSVYNLAVNKTIDMHPYSNAGTKIRWLLRKWCANVEYSWLFDLFEAFVWNESSHDSIWFFRNDLYTFTRAQRKVSYHLI